MFKDRKQAGQLLADSLMEFQQVNPIVVGVPRGGVIVGAEIAKTLSSPLDIVIARKIGVPNYPEVAIGAVTPDGEVMLNQQLMNQLNITEKHLESEIFEAKTELTRRLDLYRKGRNILTWQGRTIILADDGIATGFTISATIEYIRRQQPEKLILAVPVAPIETIREMKMKVDQLVCLIEADVFYAVGQFYEQFQQIEDDDVLSAIKEVL